MALKWFVNCNCNGWPVFCLQIFLGIDMRGWLFSYLCRQWVITCWRYHTAFLQCSIEASNQVKHIRPSTDEQAQVSSLLLHTQVFLHISSTLAENYTLQHISCYITLPTEGLNTCPLHQWYMPMRWRNWHSVLFDWMDIGRDMLHYLWRKNYIVRWPLIVNSYQHTHISLSPSPSISI